MPRTLEQPDGGSHGGGQRRRENARPRRLSWIVGLLCALVAGLTTLTPAIERWELRSHDLRFRLRGPRHSPAGEHLVLANIGDSTLQAWPEAMDRWGYHLAAAIGQARKLGASWIGLDIIPTLSVDPAADQTLALEIRNGRVVLSNLHRGDGETVNPIPQLLYASPEQPADLGFVEVGEELDNTIRHVNVYAGDSEGLKPSFPAVLALRARGQSPADAQALRALAKGASMESGWARLWLNRVGRPGSFHAIAVEKLAAGTLRGDEQAWLRSAIVLIGPTYSGSNDGHQGPGGDFYAGLELHAHALATLLDGRPLRRLPRPAEATMSAALGVLLAAALASASLGRGMLLAIGTAAGWCALAVSAFAHDRLWPAAGPLLATGLVWSGQTAATAVEEASRRRWVQNLFGRYVSAQIVDHLLEHPAALQLGGEEREVSVLFLDIRGFTAHSQGRAPSVVLAELNTFFGEIVPLVDGSGGLVLKYTGDGLLAVFGAPQALETHAQAAVEAAVAIVQASGRISAARLGEGTEPVHVGCAVHSGMVVCGNLGSAGRSEYTVIGDTVNVAARLEELNKAPELNTEFASQLLLSQATYDRLQHAPPLRGPFEFQLRGREGRIHVYQVRIPDGIK